MKLLDREFLGEFFKFFFFLVLFFFVIFLVKIYLDSYSDITETASNGVYWTFVYFVYRLPNFFVQSGVVSVAASILWVVTKKARNNEVLAWFAGGVSPLRLAVPLILAATVITFGNVALHAYVIAKAERNAYYVEKRYLKDKPEEEILQPENIYQTGAEGRFYVIERFNPATNEMTDPTIIDVYEETNTPAWILRASYAKLLGEDLGGGWEFRNVTVRRFSPQGNVEEFTAYERITDSELAKPMEPKLQAFLANLGDPDRMNFRQLWEHIKLLDAQGKSTTQYFLILHTKLALSVAVFVIALLMCAHVLRPKSQGIVAGFGGGLLWIIIYYGVFIACQRIGETGGGTLGPLLVWLPNTLFFLLGLVLLVRSAR